MARTGYFGRGVRQAPSLTNTLIAIAREYQNQRSQNIMDAWQKGGTFEGKKATDDVVLKFWRDKASGVSPDDPLADTYHNTVTQLDYTIHESKMTAQYALKKVSDAAMVKFYLGWAKKVPKDSEFYRVLQRDAGQYMRSAKNNSEAAAAKAKELAYQKAQDATHSHYEAGAEYIIDTLRRVAQSGYAKGGVGPLIAAPGSGSDFTDFDSGGVNPDDPNQRIPSDPEAMLKLLSIIDPYRDTTARTGRKTGELTGGNTDVIYHDDDKKPVTGKDIIAKLSKLSPDFDPTVPLDVAHITGILDKQMQGLQERIDRANKTGHPGDAANLTKSKAYVALLNRQVAAWPIEKSYRQLRETFDAVANDPTASPDAVLKAHDAYKAALYGLAKDPSIAADDNLRARITAEANGDGGVPTLNESFTGLAQGSYDPASAKDSANTEAHMKFLQDQKDLVTQGQSLLPSDPNKHVWTLGKTVNGVFTPDPTGREVGAALVTDIQNAGAPGSATMVTVPDPKSGGTITMMVTGTPLKATATGPDGVKVAASSGNPIGYVYSLPNGGSTDIQYGFPGPDGSLVVSHNPPFDDRLPVTPSSNGGNHFEVNLGSLIPTTTDPKDPTARLLDTSKVNLKANGDVDGMPGWSVQGAGDPTAEHPEGTNGTLVFNQYIAATSTDDRPPGGLDPATDFHSLTLSTLMHTPEGITILQDLDHNPAFKTQLQDDANAYAGVKRDPATGAWVPGTGDQTKLQNAMGQVNSIKSAGDAASWVASQYQNWQRESTAPVHNGAGSTVPGQNGTATTQQNDVFGAVSKLATDLVKGTPFEALGNMFHPGTSTMKPPPALEDRQQFLLDMGHSIKTPDVAPAIKAVTTISQQVGTVAGQTATQTGSTAPTKAQSGSTSPSPTIYTGWHGARVS